VLDRRLLGADEALADDLLAREFAVRFEENDIIVAERAVSVPARTDPVPVGRCEIR